MSESDKQAINEDSPRGPVGDLAGEENGVVDSSQSRRRFTRQAVVGGAVVFSLANRSAWSSDTQGDNCISKGFWDSFAAPGYVESIAPGNLNLEKQATLDKAYRIQDLGGSEDYELVDDGEQVCAVPLTDSDDASGVTAESGSEHPSSRGNRPSWSRGR